MLRTVLGLGAALLVGAVVGWVACIQIEHNPYKRWSIDHASKVADINLRCQEQLGQYQPNDEMVSVSRDFSDVLSRRSSQLSR